ncbi:MAG TPA: hypothetical protein VFG31_03115 [Conexibacter sp.]|nr:hypothetical protein [Conexibacter sp.]
MRSFGVALLATLLLSAFAGSASAQRNAEGVLRAPGGDPILGNFVFTAKGEHVAVEDTHVDGWSILVEVWIRGKLSRTCWDRNGAGIGYRDCNFSIAEGTPLTLYIAQAHYPSCRHKGSPSSGCKKNHWAGPFHAVA